MQVTPEFSIRIRDESYEKENRIIEEIQDQMVIYFKTRSGKLAQDGIAGKLVLPELSLTNRQLKFYLLQTLFTVPPYIM